MSQELIYTSVPKGLKAGSSGFCTVACTQGMPPALIELCESLSGYVPVFPAYDAKKANLNPVAFSHYRFPYKETVISIISRVAFYGTDYTKRTNKLAHHIIVEEKVLPRGGPAWLLSQNGVMVREWSGEPHWIPKHKILPQGDYKPKPALAWEKVTGDAGWAGLLVQSFIESPDKIAYLVFEPGMELLPLISEATALLPPKYRWQLTFNTYFTSLPQGTSCNWRGCLKGSAILKSAQMQKDVLIIDLTKPLGKVKEESVFVEQARTGGVISEEIITARKSLERLSSTRNYKEEAISQEETISLSLSQLSRQEKKKKEKMITPGKYEGVREISAFFKWGFVIAAVLLFTSLLGSAYLWFKSVGENEKLKREVVLQKREIQEKSEELIKSLEIKVSELEEREKKQINDIKGVKDLEGVKRFLLGICREKEDCRDLKEFLNKLTEPSEVERLRKQFEKIRISDEFSELGLEGVVCKEGEDCVEKLKKELAKEAEKAKKPIKKKTPKKKEGSEQELKQLRQKIVNICKENPELSECMELRQKQSYMSAIKDIMDFSKNESLEPLVRGVKNCNKCEHIKVLGFSEDTGFEIDDKNKCEYVVKVPDVVGIKKTGLTIKCEGNDLKVAVDSSVKVAQKEKILTAIKRIIIESEGGEKSIIFTQKVNDDNCSVKLPGLELGKDTNIEIGSCITDTDLRDAIESKQADILISRPRECSVDYKVGNKGKKVTIKFGVDNNNIQVKTPDIDDKDVTKLVEKEVKELVEKEIEKEAMKKIRKTIEEKMEGISDELSLLLDSKLKPLHKDISQIITQIRGVLPAAVSATEGMESTIRGVTENIRRNLDELESKSKSLPNAINQIKKDIQGIKDKILIKISDELSSLLDSKLEPLHKDISQIITQIRGVTEGIRRNLYELESKSKLLPEDISKIEKDIQDIKDKIPKKISDELSSLLDQKLKPLPNDINQIVTQIRGILPDAVSATRGMESTIRGVTEGIRRNLDELESKSKSLPEDISKIEKDIQGIKDKIEKTIQKIAKSDKSEVTNLEILKDLKEMKKKEILEEIVKEIRNEILSKCNKIKIEVKIKEETIQRLELRFNKE